jgi:hypothetical protein
MTYVIVCEENLPCRCHRFLNSDHQKSHIDHLFDLAINYRPSTAVIEMKSFNFNFLILIITTAFSVDAFTTPAHYTSSVAYGKLKFQGPGHIAGRNIVNNLTVKDVQDSGKVTLHCRIIFDSCVFHLI